MLMLSVQHNLVQDDPTTAGVVVTAMWYLQQLQYRVLITTRLYSLPEMKTWSVPVCLLVKDLNDEFLSNEVK